jgi:cold shock CspA family protein
VTSGIKAILSLEEKWSTTVVVLREDLGGCVRVLSTQRRVAVLKKNKGATITMSSEKMMKGTLEWFNATTGYGFITSIDYGEFLYFLQPPLKSHKLSGNHNLRVGDSVEFRIMEDKYGCLRAFDITAPGGGMFSGGFDDSANWNNNMDWVVDNSNDGPGCHSCNKEDVSLPVILGSMSLPGFYEMSDRCSEKVGALPMFSKGTAYLVFDEMPLGNVV